jgi:ABC-type uncharacterized transport system permease subunit
MTADRVRRIALGIAAPVLALLFALAVTSVILAISGHAPLPAYQAMWDYGTSETSMVNTINLSITYYLAAVAAAISTASRRCWPPPSEGCCTCRASSTSPSSSSSR